MKEYGIENFDFEIICECAEEELNSLEEYYIKKYNSSLLFNSSKGYNVETNCSQVGGRIARKVKCLDTGEIFNSSKDASIKYNGDSSTIRRCCNGILKSAFGLKWSWLNEETELDIIDRQLEEIKDIVPYSFYANLKQYITKNNTHTYYNATKNSKLILCNESKQLFVSISKTAKWIGVSENSIKDILNNKNRKYIRNRYNDKQYSFTLIEKYKIIKLDSQHNIIQEYNSIYELAKELNVTDEFILDVISNHKFLNEYTYELNLLQ